MAIDFNAFLNRKYDLMGQEAARPAAQAAPQTINVSTGTPGSGPGKEKNDSGLASENNGLVNIPTSFTKPVNLDDTTSTLPAGSGSANSFDLLGPKGFGMYKKGIARVPGKGDGTKDTVKAKLAPGEAVLNKAAADNMGRGLIAALNKMGAKKMGMV
jgi:hypothetical protein